MIKLGEIGKYVFGLEFISGFAIGLTFYWEAQAAILELGIVRIIIDWDIDEASWKRLLMVVYENSGNDNMCTYYGKLLDNSLH